MAIWKEQSPAKKDPIVTPPEPVARREQGGGGVPADLAAPRTQQRAETKETLIAADLNIEGKIEGAGHVRVAGRFKGDIHVEGNLTIDAGAKVTGGVRANTVVIGGELDGNVDAAARVELLETGVLNGDLKAGSLIVAAGSRMRGQAEFGWESKQTAGSRPPLEAGSIS